MDKICWSRRRRYQINFNQISIKIDPEEIDGNFSKNTYAVEAFNQWTG